MDLLTFLLDDTTYAVEAHAVIEIVARVDVTPLPAVAPHVAGAIRYRGAVVPVVDLRARFGLAPRAPRIEDHFVVASTARRTVALVVDRVIERETVAEAAMREAPVALRGVAGLAATADGIVVLHDVEAALSLDEGAAVDAAIEATLPAT
jgi:purine-binding chemotaxis protein CheW